MEEHPGCHAFAGVQHIKGYLLYALNPGNYGILEWDSYIWPDKLPASIIRLYKGSIKYKWVEGTYYAGY